jgi:repressor LexA
MKMGNRAVLVGNSTEMVDMEHYRGILGENLRALREMNHISQDELGRIAGVTRETVNKWESGAIGNIRNKNLDNIREHFQLSIDDLRSETCGLAAQVKGGAGGAGLATSASCPLWRGDVAIPGERIEIPATLATRHPACIALAMPDDSMSRAIPKGAVVIVDTEGAGSPEAAMREVPPSLAGLYLLRRADDSLAIRRIVFGATSAFVSTASYQSDEPDEMLPTSDLGIVGPVVWYQPATA